VPRYCTRDRLGGVQHSRIHYGDQLVSCRAHVHINTSKHWIPLIGRKFCNRWWLFSLPRLWARDPTRCNSPLPGLAPLLPTLSKHPSVGICEQAQLVRCKLQEQNRGGDRTANQPCERFLRPMSMVWRRSLGRQTAVHGFVVIPLLWSNTVAGCKDWRNARQH
jgi:hypothetical protein